MSLDAALNQLNRLPVDERLAALLALEEKRQKDFFCKYWGTLVPEDAEDKEEYLRFFDKIEEDFKKFTPEKKVFGILGGNRSSKTERGAFIAIAFLLGKDYFKDEPTWRYVQHLPIPKHGVNIWVVGLSYEVVQKVLWDEKLRKGLRHPGLIPNDTAVITKVVDSEGRQMIEVDVKGRKSTLTCKSAEAGADKFQSASVDLVWLDEECSKAIFDECWQRTLDCAGKILVTLTPLNDVDDASKDPWVFDLHEAWLAGQEDLEFVSLNVLENPYLPKSERNKIERRWILSGDKEGPTRVYGYFLRRSGLVHTQFEKSVHLVARKQLPKEWYRVGAIDPAPTGPTGAVIVAFDPEGNAYLEDVYKEANQIVSSHAKNILTQFSGKHVDVWLIDPRGGNQKNAETHRTCADLYKQNGIPVRFPNFDEKFARERFDEYLAANHEQTAVHPRFYAFEDQLIFIQEVTSYCWDFYTKGPLRGKSKGVPKKGNDDVLQALGFCVGFMNGKKPPRRVIRADIAKKINAQHNSYF